MDDPVVGEHMLVELPDRNGVGVRLGVEDAAVQEGVIHHDHPAGAGTRHDLRASGAVLWLMRYSCSPGARCSAPEAMGRR